MNHAEIYRIALAAGFKLKLQPDRTMDISPAVYRFAEALLEQGRQVALYHRERAEAYRAERDEAARKWEEEKAAREGETVPRWKHDALIAQCLASDAQREEAWRQLRALNQGDTAGAWCWMGDGHDHLETLTCPVLIPANDLRALIDEKQAAALEGLAGRLSHNEGSEPCARCMALHEAKRLRLGEEAPSC